MIYCVDGEEYDEEDLWEMEVGELHKIKLIAEKAFTDQKIIIGRGKVDFRSGKDGLSPVEYARAKNIQNEAQGLITCIELIIREIEEDD